MPPIQQFSAVPSDYTRLAQEQVARIRERQSGGNAAGLSRHRLRSRSRMLGARSRRSGCGVAAADARWGASAVAHDQGEPRQQAQALANQTNQRASLDMMQRMFTNRQAALRDAACGGTACSSKRDSNRPSRPTQADQLAETLPAVAARAAARAERSKMPSSCRSKRGAATRRAATRRGTARGDRGGQEAERAEAERVAEGTTRSASPCGKTPSASTPSASCSGKMSRAWRVVKMWRASRRRGSRSSARPSACRTKQDDA